MIKLVSSLKGSIRIFTHERSFSEEEPSDWSFFQDNRTWDALRLDEGMVLDDKITTKRDTKEFLICTFTTVKGSGTMSIYETTPSERGSNWVE